MRLIRLGLTAMAAACCVTAGAVLAAADEAADPHAATITLQDENASVSSAKLTDRFYVNGLRLGYTSGLGDVPQAAQDVGQEVWGGGKLRLGVGLSQQIFTPADTLPYVPPANDRPYAGVLMGTLSLQRDVEDSRSTLGLSLGVVGPAALAQEVQNGFHDIISQGHTNGWHAQLHNEPVLELTSARTWRLPTGSLGGLETDVLPELAVGLGNLKVYGQTGVAVRLGQGLMSDYGVARVAPGASGGDAFVPARPFAWYVFVGATGQGVAHDLTLEGNDFEDSASVKLKPLQGELTAGLALMAFGTRLTYTQVVQTQEFQHQRGGLHQMGSLALSVRF